MVTVIIPTANRPHYLRTALRSVQRQSAVGQIKRVIVSEHLGNRASEEVCKEFAGLPIQYFFRDPEGDAKRGFRLMLDEVKTEFVAVLFDDDWWGPEHIAHGVRCLAANPGLSCYFAAYFMVEAERSLVQCHSTREFWHGAGFPSLEGDWTLTLNDVVAACLVDVPCTYSSMIAPLDIFDKAYDASVAVGNVYDSDRVLTLELATRGPVIVNPIPEVFVRFHPGQDKNRFSSEMVQRYKRLSIEHLLRICREHDINPGTDFDQRIACAPERASSAVCQAVLKDCEDLVADRTIQSKALLEYRRESREGERAGQHQQGMRTLLKQLLPPVVVNWGQVIRRRMTDRTSGAVASRQE